VEPRTVWFQDARDPFTDDDARALSELGLDMPMPVHEPHDACWRSWQGRGACSSIARWARHHAKAILEAGAARVIGFDRDPRRLAIAGTR
jgi:hypothetical protein